MSNLDKKSKKSFSSLGLSPKLVQVLTGVGLREPTPIQVRAIPPALLGRDVIGIAQTGTGKTLAFTLPMIERLARSKQQSLIIAPTRELAEQITESWRKIGSVIGLRQVLVVGGVPLGRQISGLQRRPHVIVGTPGRLNDHLKRGTLKLNSVDVLVLDEADRMLDMGFAPQINMILRQVPKQRQTMLFSATMPAKIEQMAAKYLRNPVRVQATPAGTVAERVAQEIYIISRQQKNRLLEQLLADYSGSVLVFSRTKYGAKRICRSIRNMNHAAAEIHSNLTVGQRRRALAGFKTGEVRVMVATDIASRGIDVSDIELVINYDLPDHLDDYVHRVGRTGRAGKPGKAISFVHPDQRHQVRSLERLVRQKISISPLPKLPAEHKGGEYFQHKPDQRRRKAYLAKRQSRRAFRVH